MTKITIKVLAKDIKENKYTSPTNCAIAKAVKRVIDPNKSVLIGMNAIDIGLSIKYSPYNSYSIPEEIQEKLKNMYAFVDPEGWGNAKPTEPQDFEFEIELND